MGDVTVCDTMVFASNASLASVGNRLRNRARKQLEDCKTNLKTHVRLDTLTAN
jgi:hypothetical protein